MSVDIKLDWAGIEARMGHRCVVRHMQGRYVAISDLESFQKFIGIHTANLIVDMVGGAVNRGIKIKIANGNVVDAYSSSTRMCAYWIAMAMRRYMPYATINIEHEAPDWHTVIAIIDGTEYYICSISFQMDLVDDRVSIDFYCEEQ